MTSSKYGEVSIMSFELENLARHVIDMFLISIMGNVFEESHVI